MKKILLFFGLALFTYSLSAQNCSNLFISKYTEGYANNRAVEIYNPTSSAINLSGYSLGRFRNGDINFDGFQLPNDMIQPYDTYLIGLDKRDSLGTCFEIPMWNGYQKWDVCIDQLTGLPIINAEGDTVYCVQYADFQCTDGAIPHHQYGTEYNDFLDLQGKVDLFTNPVYVSGGVTSMYFNGDDAVALISGTAVAADGSNILDVVGVIGEDPGQAWETAAGGWITRDRTIVREPNVEEGNAPVFALGDTMVYSEWEIFPKNTFYVYDGTHSCTCDPNYVNTNPINQIDFNVYPNPITNDFVVIDAEENITNVTLHNLLGQVAFDQNYEGFNQHLELQLPKLQTGIYTVTLRFEDNSRSVKKLMIQ